MITLSPTVADLAGAVPGGKAVSAANPLVALYFAAPTTEAIYAVLTAHGHCSWYLNLILLVSFLDSSLTP